jgi:hypothetical protein
MFTQIQMHNDKASVSGAALKKIILDRLPHQILEQMHTVDLTGKTDEEIISIITNAGRTAEKWDEAKTILGLRKTVTETRRESSGRPRFEKKETRFDKPKVFKKRFQGSNDQSNKKFKNKSNKTYAEQTEGIDKSELDRRKAAGEYQRCAWPGDRKVAHKTMDCFRWARKDIGTAPFHKAKEYQKLKIGAYDQEEDSESEIDLYTTDDESSEEEEEEGEEGDEEDEEKSNQEEFPENFSEQDSDHKETESPEKNWWDDYGSDRK